MEVVLESFLPADFQRDGLEEFTGELLAWLGRRRWRNLRSEGRIVLSGPANPSYKNPGDYPKGPHVKIIGPFHGLVGNRMAAGPEGASSLQWVPWLNNIPPIHPVRKIPLHNWLNRVVTVDGKNNQFTREDLILCVCNEDGGAHIDPKIDKDYADLSRHNSMGWQLMKNGIGIDEEGPHLSSIRQIAHEVINTLRDEFPQAFDGLIYNPIFK